MALYEFNGKRPRVDPSAYVHPSAVLIGDVTVGACCYIGPHASLRGDFGAVVVERGSNVQDSCVLHTGVANACRLGVDSHVGHSAIIHGATLEPNTMVGMHAVVMDGVVLGAASIVAACAFVKKDWRVPAGVLVAGRARAGGAHAERRRDRGEIVRNPDLPATRGGLPAHDAQRLRLAPTPARCRWRSALNAQRLRPASTSGARPAADVPAATRFHPSPYVTYPCATLINCTRLRTLNNCRKRRKW